MPSWIPDLVIAALILGMTYALSSEGLWGAALMFFNVLFGGMIAFNFYEPVAGLIDKAGLTWGMSDSISLIVLFAVSVLLLRLTTESLAPSMVRFPPPVYHVGRFLFGLAASTVAVAILTLAVACAPGDKKIINYKARPPFGLGIDHQWLAFFQFSTGKIFAQYGKGTIDPFREFGKSAGGNVPVNAFDMKGEWLIIHQEARPYGDPAEGVLGAPEAPTDAAAGGGAAPAGGAAPGGAAPKGPPGMPGMPGAATSKATPM